jgi:multisubunit Na+/H+ antiporter MnhF subunit
MSQWTLAAIVLSCGFVPLGGVCLRSDRMSAVVALALASTLTTAVLVVLTIALRRQPFIDLAVVLVSLSVVGVLAFARLIERRG